MEPIISPWVFYFISVAEELKSVSVLLLTLSLTISITGIFYIAVFNTCINEVEEKAYSNMKRIIKISSIISLATFIIQIFIPSREAIYQMLIAQHVTPDNLQYFKGEMTNLVDYIVNQIKTLK